jgi:hypothetical protein
MRVLNSRVFAGVPSSTSEIYNDMPIYDDDGSGYSGLGSRGRTNSMAGSATGDDYEYRDRPKRASTWQDDVYDRQPTSATRTAHDDSFGSTRSRGSTVGDDYSYSDRKPSRPTAPKPQFKPRPSQVGKDQAVALFTFDAAQEGDLGFKKGDVITIVKRTNNATDWWTGRIGDREGIFPRYVDCG